MEKLVRRIVKVRGEAGDVTALEAEVNEGVYRLFARRIIIKTGFAGQ